MDGVGDPDRRPTYKEPVWSQFDDQVNFWETNDVGTDEFITFCRLIGAEPMIVLNMGTGSVEEAAAWVEYCNGTGNTYYANLRRQNGHEEPYRIRYWGVGNEEQAEPDAKFQIKVGNGLEVTAQTVPTPFYDPDNLRQAL